MRQFDPIDTLRAKLSDHHLSGPNMKPETSTTSNEENTNPQAGSSSGSALLTPASEPKGSLQNSHDRDVKARAEAVEVARLQLELHKAQDEIARQAHAMHSNHGVNLGETQDLAADFKPEPSPVANQRNYVGFGRQGWGNNDDTKSDLSDFNNPPTEWSMPARPAMNFGLAPDPWGFPTNRGFNQRAGPNMSMMMPHEQQQQQRNYSVPISPIGSGLGRGMQHHNAPNFARGFGFSNYGPRNGYPMMFQNPGAAPFNGVPPGPNMQGQGPNQGYQPQPIGTPLSPAANTFNPGQVSQHANPWNAGVSTKL